MYLTRAKAIRKLPLPRKGTKYLARASSHLNSGIPVVIAVRDVLKLAKNSKEVKIMINDKLLKINGKEVKKCKESIRLFNIFEAGKKKYKLMLLPTGRFTFEETKTDERVCKVLNKSVLKGKIIQVNLHDGGNIISKEKINVGDSIILDKTGKIKKVIPLEKGSKIFVSSGGSLGLSGKIESMSEGKVEIKFGDRAVELDQGHVIAV